MQVARESLPMFGTGKVIYTLVGYLLKKDLLGSVGTLMPYASLMRRIMTGLVTV
jgi:hypothetical protein